MQLLKPLLFQDATSQSTALAVSSSTPLADAVTGAAGSGTSAARSDHVHPFEHGSTPSVAKGNGAGSGTTTISGTDRRGTITCAPAGIIGGAIIGTVTFGTAYGATPGAVLISPANSNAALKPVYADTLSTTGWVLTASTNPSASTTYIWYYVVVD